ncbi:hypothetical protein POM88_016738 [Heracleum sosnowskyi]|uniref:SIS domain-containing protein n=1 Tax=Heracleum sosnowskyi TaxID=360622 RepID=A0AAD8MT95_9APIA|nr:hypothetical protein POM88_016738 [Heracleum sosnowskyi]
MVLVCDGHQQNKTSFNSSFVTQKISQTLVSLGIRAGFLSPVDALHGDIGILNVDDILVLFSKSGNTEELLKLVPCVKAKGVYVISITSLESNALMGVCDFNVFLPLERELCPFDLASVTFTAIQMVFGDTVAIAMMSARNLSRDECVAHILNIIVKDGWNSTYEMLDVAEKYEKSFSRSTAKAINVEEDPEEMRQLDEALEKMNVDASSTAASATGTSQPQLLARLQTIHNSNKSELQPEICTVCTVCTVCTNPGGGAGVVTGEWTLSSGQHQQAAVSELWTLEVDTGHWTDSWQCTDHRCLSFKLF